MASNFSSLRSSRKSILSKLAEEAKKETQKGNGADERFWKLTVDPKTKIGYARIRFLPAPKGEELPWVRVFSHGFQGPGGSWFIENCPTTLGQRSCPVCKGNNKLWNSGIEADKDVARKRKRRLHFISNILVLEDGAKPENNGKVFLFKYGAKIHDKIKELIEPEFPDQTPCNPFDMWEGADFKLKSRDYQGFQNYDKSEFDDATELFEGDDDAKEALWEQQYSLMAFLDEKEFKSYEELESRMREVLTGDADAPKTAEEALRQEEPEVVARVAERVAQEDKRVQARTPAKRTPKAPVVTEDDDAQDDIRKFFSELGDD